MNSMPFRQLKSFLKILIGVQYKSVLNYSKSLCCILNSAAEAFMRIMDFHRLIDLSVKLRKNRHSGFELYPHLPISSFCVTAGGIP